MFGQSRSRLGWLVLTASTALAAMAPVASADTSEPVFTCRASAARLVLPNPLPTVEPILANGAVDPFERAQCVDDDAGNSDPVVLDNGGLPPRLTVQAPFARTRIDPDLGDARDQTVQSEAGVANVAILLPDGTPLLTADAVQSQAAGSCNGTTPVFAGSSRVVLVTLAGQPIDPDQPLEQIADGFNASPLGALAQINFNEQTTTNTPTKGSLTQRAIRVRLFAGDGQTPGATPISEVVVAESMVDRTGAVCAAEVVPMCPAGSTPQLGSDPLVCIVPPAPCPAGSTPAPNGQNACIIRTAAPPQDCPAGTTRDPNSSSCVQNQQACPEGATRDPKTGNCVLARPCPSEATPDSNGVCVVRSQQVERQVCPNGSTFDAERNRCIIERGPGRGDDIIVGRIGDVPVGGTVAPIDAVQKVFGASTCTRGSGPAFAILGTKGGDRITGTNGPDRIITFAGNDRVDGGRGDDCIEGRGDNDVLTGGLGADRVIGGSGRDALNGGGSSDVLDGGTGNDTINANFGQDRITGGSGNDAINVATAGKAASVNCGSGRDKVRGNQNERKKVRNCELRYFLR